MPPRQGYRKFVTDLLTGKGLAGMFGLLGLAFMLSLTLLGCRGGGGDSASTPTANLSQNYHPSGWISSHPGSAIAGVDACTKCHQLAVATAGSNVPTCASMLCHHKTLPAWGTVAIHGTRAKLAPGTDGGSLVSCQICHGKDFSGGVAAKSCASCHGVAAPHPAKPWHDAAGSNHATTNPANAVVCAQCHFPGAPANPVGHPVTPAPAGTAPGCTNNTLCHGTIQATHQVPFLGSQHTGVTQVGFNGSCATCHAVSGASPVASAPLCSACHQAGSPLAVTACASCHGKPPTGASFPNVAGAHVKHNALAGVAGTCSACHQGADSGTQTHYDHADGRAGKDSLRTGPGLVAFLSAYSGNAGTATFNPATLTCSNVSCHGGQTTPAWTASGSLNTAADCTRCHALGTAPGVPENNSVYSGFHALHMNSSAKLLCTECHNMANGSSGALGHLTNLGTAAMEGVAAETIVLTGGSFSAAAKTCTVVCHGKTHASYTWTGNGGVHPAGWIASHPGSALAGLNTCKICHGAQLTGGPFSEPSCFTAACHHNTQPNYALAGSHGLRAKLGQSSSGGGLASCQACHGTNFASGLTASDGTTKACTTCHGVAAPHPAKPWHNASGSTHATTDATNAPVCAQCHFPGASANPAGHPATPAPAGTAPGCFNNTLCHGAEAAPHALGSVWTTATSAAFHGIAAKKDLASCQACHGNPGSTNFEGGASAATKCSSCHVQARAHADRWVQAPGAFPAYAASHRDAGNRAVACALCHDGTKGRTAPDVTAPSCFSASANAVACHVNGPGQPNHAVPFLGGAHAAATAATFTSDCSSCHATSGTSPLASAPLCNTCHKVADPTLTATGTGTCLSCHSGTPGLPAGPGGASFPSVAGAHAKHMVLPTTLTCDSCHAGSGSGTAAHYANSRNTSGPAPVAISSSFNSKAATAAFAPGALTCSNVSCHGGQTTPAWTTAGSINSALDCTKCHSVAASVDTVTNFNDAFGRHALGTHNAATLANGIACTTCHSMTNGSGGALAHFKYLNTPAVDGTATGLPADQLPSGTIVFDTTIVTGSRTYSVTSGNQGNGGCALTCHTHIHSAAVNAWTASGTPHPVPFGAGQTDTQNNGHFTASATTFSSDCSSCHAISGTSPTSSAPLCTSCHRVADPTLTATGTGTCLSCHSGAAGLPAGPGGASFPSIAGAHAKHMVLPTTLTCDSCHAGSGSGTAAHYANSQSTSGPAPVAINSTFNSKAATAAFAPGALTCSNVSCHGGQTTPAWTTAGSINSASDCTKCHSVAASVGTATNFNDAFGRHALGTHNAATLANGIACTTCHSMTNGSSGAAAHFKYLNTPAVDGTATGLPADQLPSGTIVFDAGIVTGARTYSATSGTQGNGGCALTCHTHVHTAAVDTWTAAGTPHPVPFGAGQTDTQNNGHFTASATTFSSDCSSCHAISGTSPSASAPLCNTCHKVANPTLTATGTGTCLSCHSGTAGLPTGPGGASFPSIAGAHAKHMVLPTTLTCDTCHAGSGAGTATHYANSRSTAGPAPVAISVTYNSKAATAAFTPGSLTCSNVSCHGGQTTPAWITAGSINSATDCTKCHSVTLAPAGTQYNNAFGRHSMGTHNATAAGSTIACTTCHSMTIGSSGALAHFKYLNTPAVDGTATGLPADQMPSGTLVFDAAIVTGARTYSVTSGTQGNGGCALTCHNHIHTPTYETWTASGSSHPIPFLGGQNDSQLNGHLTVTAAAFTSDCAVCHAYTGTSPLVGAPLCSTCHRLADPTVLATGSGTCQSCHGGSAVPTLGPNGSGFPSIAGAHAKHMGLATQLTCDTCHAGSGSGTTTHYTNANARITVPSGPVPVAVSATFTAKTGGSPAFTPASLTCSNVSCHGGQVTPGWQTGLLNSATDCTKCHGVATSAGTVTQFNDGFGRHSMGTHNATTAANAIACTTCHSMGNGSLGAQAHFKYLDTPAVDGVSTGSPADQLPSGTIAFDAAIVSGARTYSTTGATQGNGGCALTCHTHIHVATVETWTASGAPHGIPFLAGQVDTQNNGHLTATQATFTADCGTCHATSGTSPVTGAPSCSICHSLANPVAVATGSGTCLSCHVGGSGLPVGPEGASYPSIAGSHGKHLRLPTTLTCDTCHTGSGTGSTTHYTNANARVAPPTGPGSVALDATYNAQTGGSATFSPSALTCATVSCHGGKTTPAWTAANSIASTTDCTKCHAINGGSQPAQYNDALGRHSYGTHSLAGTADCTLCHDMSAANASIGAVKHFAELNSTNVGGSSKLPSGTVKFKTGNATYPISGAMTYSVTAPYAEADGGCAVVCHAQTHTPTPTAYHWNAPQGSGASHPIPFLGTDLSTGGNPHQSVTLAQFNGECSNCHDQTGASAKSGPVCTVCHTLGSPLGTGMTVGTCLSCHVGAAFTTQGPTGSAWPNLKGSHPKHLALSTFTRGTPALPTGLASTAYPQCQSCHFKSLPGDTNNTHYSNASKRVASPISSGPASVAVHATFNAQSGTAGFVSSASAFTCSNISCHGGQVTPGWQTGTLTVNANTYCITCHKITSTATQYNDATGRHNNPSAHNQTCDHCHDMSTATNNRTGVVNHFKYLDTTAVRITPDQLSSDTIKFGGGTTPATGALTYTVNATLGRGGCALSCHGTSHTTSGNIWN